MLLYRIWKSVKEAESYGTNTTHIIMHPKTAQKVFPKTTNLCKVVGMPCVISRKWFNYKLMIDVDCPKEKVFIMDFSKKWDELR